MTDPTKTEFEPSFPPIDAAEFVAAAAAHDKTPGAAGYRDKLAVQFEAAGLNPNRIPTAEAIAQTLIPAPEQ